MSTLEIAWRKERAGMNLPVANMSWEDAITQHHERDWHGSRQEMRDKRGEAMNRAGGWHKKTQLKRALAPPR